MADGGQILRLAVIIYRPLYGNFHHWALESYSVDSGTHRLFQADGEPNQLKKETRIVPDPQTSDQNFIKRIIVGEIQRRECATMIGAIDEVEVQNHVSEWDCQDYVLEMLDKLEEEYLFNDDENYPVIKEKLKSMRGSIEHVRKRVVSYDPDHLHDDDDGAEDEEDDEDEDEDDDGVLAIDSGRVRSAEMVEDSDDEGDNDNGDDK